MDLEGEFELTAVVQGDEDTPAGVTSRLERRVRAQAGATDVLLRMRRASSISGSVVGARDERPGEDVVLTLAPDPPDPARPTLTQEQGRHDGTWEFHDVPPGRWRLTARAKRGRHSPPQFLEAPAVDVRVVLEGPPAVAGRLLGVHVAGFDVQVLGSGAAPALVTRRVEDDGAFRLEGDEGATVTLFACRPGDDRFALREGLPMPSEGLEVELQTGLRIEGRLTGAALPSDPARVLLLARSSRGLLARGTVEADGRFVVQGLPPGESWALHARVVVDAAWGEAVAESVAPGARDVELSLQWR